MMALPAAADRDCVRTMQQTLMKTEMTGGAAGDLAQVMIPHHQSAIGMIDVLLAQRDDGPEIRSMAEKIGAAPREAPCSRAMAAACSSPGARNPREADARQGRSCCPLNRVPVDRARSAAL